MGLIVFLSVSIGVAWKASQSNPVSPNAPASKPAACDEQCPGSDGVLRNCTGEQAQSLCLWQGRKESCGGKVYCCPSENGAWTSNLSLCNICTATPPTNLSTESISGNSQKLKWTNGQGGLVRIWVSKHSNPTANCSGGDGDKSLCVVNDQRIEDGSEEYLLTDLEPNTTYYWRMMTWKESGCDAGSSTYNFKTSNSTCTPTTWTPETSSTCIGTNITQTSDCSTTRVVPGTKDCSCTPNGVVTCTTDCSSACGQQATSISTCTDSCGGQATKQCPATASCCVDTVWLPDAGLTCSGAKVTQTSNCGASRVVDGAKYCCTETSWTPTSVSSVCSDRTVTQTSNCGTTREINGTKTCYPDLEVTTKTYNDDSRNTEGNYYTDKEITKISRGEIMIYTMEVKNVGEGGAKNVVISDTLVGQNQNLLSFVDSENKCKFDFATKRLTCNIDLIPYRGAEKIKFRVKVSETALNGKIIRNTMRVVYGNKTKEDTVETLVSSVVECNEVCSNDSECSSGLACDVISGKCRRPSCTSSTTCTCTSTPKITAEITSSPTVGLLPETEEETPSLTTTKKPTATLTDRYVADVEAGEENSSLPSTGILDLPQGGLLGGGVVLILIGILLAL